MRLAVVVALLLGPLAAGAGARPHRGSHAPSRGAAEAPEIPCGRVENGGISVDGLLEDWADVPPLLVAASGAGDQGSGLSVRCNFDDTSLYLLAEVHDEHLSRSRKAGAAPTVPGRALGSFPVEDGLEVVFEDQGRLSRLRLLPGDPKRAIPALVSWDPTRAGKVEAIDALEREGWAFEVRVPLAEVPGWRKGASQLRMAVVAHDAAPGRRPQLVATAPLQPGRLNRVALGDEERPFDTFLEAMQLSAKDVRWTEPGPGGGRFVLAKNLLAYVSDTWSYVELPVESPADVLEVRRVDLAGDGVPSPLVRFREHGEGGSSREILAAYRVSGVTIARSFGVEVAKALGKSQLKTRVELVRRGAATDIVVEAQPAVGWDSTTYREATAADVVPIPLPWSRQPRLHFQFRGDEYFRIE